MEATRDRELEQAVSSAQDEALGLAESVRAAEGRVRAPWEERLAQAKGEVQHLVAEVQALEAKADQLEHEQLNMQVGSGGGGAAAFYARSVFIGGMWLGSAAWLGSLGGVVPGLVALAVVPVAMAAARWLGRSRR